MFLENTKRLSVVVMLSLLLLAGLAGMVAASSADARVSGTVLTPDGGLVPAGTVVKLYEPRTERLVGQADVENATGNFQFPPVVAGVYLIRAEPPQRSAYEPSALVPVSVTDVPISGLFLTLTRPQIVGTVTTPDGVTPITSTVDVIWRGRLVQRVPAPNGQFKIGGLNLDSYSLQAAPATSEPYWLSERLLITPTQSVQTVTLSLRDAQLYGTVSDPFGRLLSGAKVDAIPAGGDNTSVGTAALVVTTDSREGGFWAIGGLGDGDYLLQISPPRRRADLISPAPLTVTVPSNDNPYELAFLASSKTVTGLVFYTPAGSGQLPISGAKVIAKRLDRRSVAETVTGPDGTYQLNLSTGLWAMTVESISGTIPSNWVYPRPPQLVSFGLGSEPETRQQDFEVLVADASVSGRVEMPDGSAPPFTVTVAFNNNEGLGQRTLVDANGDFSVVLPSGSYKVFVNPQNPRFLAPYLDPVRVPPNENLDLGTITLITKTALITGVLSDDGGNPVEGVVVTAWRVGTPETLRTRSGPGGQYILPVVPGWWLVRPAPGPQQAYLYRGPAERVGVRANQTATDVNFTLTAAEAQIIGQLVDGEGNPVTDVDGWASAFGGPAQPQVRLRNGAPIIDGRFTLYVPAGSYTVTAQLPPGSPYMSTGRRNVNISAGETLTGTLTVIRKDGSITGFLKDARTEEAVSGVEGVVAAWGGGHWTGTRIDSGNGTYNLPVSAGVWNLGYAIDPRSDYAKQARGHQVTVPENGSTARTLLVLEKDGLITGTVLAPDGRPLAGILVVADGVGVTVQDVRLRTLSGSDGNFSLRVPRGRYRLAALDSSPAALKPAEINIIVPEGGVSGGHVLQFRRTDATLSGTLALSTSLSLDGDALLWAWSEDGGFVRQVVPIIGSTGTYSLNVISNTTWYLGAIFDTPSEFWAGRTSVVMGNGDATQDLSLQGPFPKPGPVAVTFDAAEPQRLELADGTDIFIPAGAMPVDGEVTLRIVPIGGIPLQRNLNVYRYGYAIIAVDERGQTIEENFDQEVTIRFSYTDAELARQGINEDRLQPAYFATTTNHWEFPESYAVDAAANEVTMQVDHFTDFALMSVDESNDTSGFSMFLPLVIR